MQCPICKKRVTGRDDPREPNRYFPFCSDRCQLIDLGRWLKGDYQVPAEGEDEAGRPGFGGSGRDWDRVDEDLP